MKTRPPQARTRLQDFWLVVTMGLSGILNLSAQPPPTQAPSPARLDTRFQTNYSGQVKTLSGRVQYLPDNRDWIPAVRDQAIHPGDQLLTARPGRAAGVLTASDSSSSTAKFLLREDSLLHLVRGADTNRSTHLLREGQALDLDRGPQITSFNIEVERGELYLREDGRTNRFHIGTPFAAALPRGTEFLVIVNKHRRQTTLVMFDGEAEMVTGDDRRTVHARSFGTAAPGQPIRVQPLIEATNIVQWWIRYPSFMEPDDLGLNPQAMAELAESIAAYRRGNLRAAWERHPGFPEHPIPDDGPRALYLAALLLGSGQIEAAERCLELPQARTHPSALALRRIGRALSHPLLPLPPNVDPRPEPARTSTEWLSESYVLQSEHRLPEALRAARIATEKAPQSGWAWARLAELEFSQGELRRAEATLATALRLSPENAQARTLQGFLTLARNRSRDALAVFDDALRIDSEMADAWLGHGLAQLRRGNVDAGLEDLSMARVLEPGRSLVHSYAGKALADIGLTIDADEAFALAEVLDPQDPTPPLYRALLDQQENRVPSAVTNLEQSLALNDNRAVYRSRLLLDQDRAIRGANLASVYREAGLNEYAVRQASRAVEDDYTSFSAHQFLADSYNALRDPGQISLRYESAWFSEYLTANLLAPVGASRLSTTVSPNEYSRFFEREGPGFVSRTDYASNGDWRQAASQFGNFANFAYAVDAYYLSDNGQRINSDSEQLTVSAQVKEQIGLNDSVFLQAIYYDAEFGDVRPVYDPTDRGQIHEDLRVHENQEPLLLLGWNHHWQEGSDTLFLVSRLQDRYRLQDPEYPQWSTLRNPNGSVAQAQNAYGQNAAPLEYASELVIGSFEGQQIWRTEQQTLVAGIRGQTGMLATESDIGSAQAPGGTYISALSQKSDADLGRVTAYAYEHWQAFDWLRLSAGLAYDWLRQPVNYRLPPLADGEEDSSLLSPKAGLTLTPWDGGAFRAAYAKALGGVSLEQSVRLEPTQIAGLNQTYRSLIPEALQGSVAGQEFDLWGLGFEQRFPSRTYLTLRAESRKSGAEREIGSRDFHPKPGDWLPGLLRESIDYEERVLAGSVHQFLGSALSVGAEYQLSDVLMKESIAGLPGVSEHEGTLQRLALGGRFNDESGFFAGIQGVWTRQSNRGYSRDRPGDDFWHLNLDAGWRSRRRNFEVGASVLNVTDQDYRLNPLNLYAEPYRSTTLVLSMRFEL